MSLEAKMMDLELAVDAVEHAWGTGPVRPYAATKRIREALQALREYLDAPPVEVVSGFGESMLKDMKIPAGPIIQMPPADKPKCAISDREPELHHDMERMMNRLGVDTKLNTPDFLLADFVGDVLGAYALLNDRREQWHGRAAVSDPLVREHAPKSRPEWLPEKHGFLQQYVSAPLGSYEHVDPYRMGGNMRTADYVLTEGSAPANVRRSCTDSTLVLRFAPASGPVGQANKDKSNRLPAIVSVTERI